MKKLFLVLVLFLGMCLSVQAAYTLSTVRASIGDGFKTFRITVTMATDDDSADTITFPEIIASCSTRGTKSFVSSALKGMIWWIAAKPGTAGAAPAAALEIDIYSNLPVKKVATVTGFATATTEKVDMGSVSSNSLIELQNGDYFQLNDFPRL